MKYNLIPYVRTEYSFGKTYAPLNKVIERLLELNASHAIIMDDDTTFGHIPFHIACRAAGIEPILGVSLVVALRTGDKTRMAFAALTGEGLRNLYKLTSLSLVKGGLAPPDIAPFRSGLLILSGDIVEKRTLMELGAVLDLSPASRILNGKKRLLGLPMIERCDNAYLWEDDLSTFGLIPRPDIKVTPQHLYATPQNEVTASIIEAYEGVDLPVAPMIRAEGDIESLCRQGIIERGLDWPVEYEQRLQYELGIIRAKDFESYFIIVSDLIRHMKMVSLVGVGRGSSAGSLVCYLLQITEIDPIPYGLFFERFIDINRFDLPDIDTDFEDSKRHLAFEYMSNKYGRKHVANIGTVSKLKSRSALVQVAKALDIKPWELDELKNSIIERGIADARSNACLLDSLTDTIAGRHVLDKYPAMIHAASFEGHASHTGVHAAGLLVTTGEITDYCSVNADGVAQIDKYSAEAIGLLKIDVLGLKTLSVLADNQQNIDWYNIPLDDPLTYDVLNRGRLSGIFQFEGQSMRSISHDIHFKSISDIAAVTAIARPGAFNSGSARKYVERHNGATYKKLHPRIELLMEETLGVPIYQETVIAIVNGIGKFSWEETSYIRKAMSKSQGVDAFTKYKDQFMRGALSQGIPEQDIEDIWLGIASSGSWLMNKSHVVSYSLISYMTAYYKANYPLEFAAANLRHSHDDDAALGLLKELVNDGIEFVPFDIHRSKASWAAIDGKLYGGFDSLKGIGDKKAGQLVAARDSGALTPKMIALIEASERTFGELRPIQAKYGDWYSERGAVHIGDIPDSPAHHAELVIVATVIQKTNRSMHEDVEIKKRSGKQHIGEHNFMQMRLQDDTGVLGARITWRDWQRMGIKFLNEVPVGGVCAFRVRFFNGIRYGYVSSFKAL